MYSLSTLDADSEGPGKVRGGCRSRRLMDGIPRCDTGRSGRPQRVGRCGAALVCITTIQALCSFLSRQKHEPSDVVHVGRSMAPPPAACLGRSSVGRGAAGPFAASLSLSAGSSTVTPKRTQAEYMWAGNTGPSEGKLHRNDDRQKDG